MLVVTSESSDSFRGSKLWSAEARNGVAVGGQGVYAVVSAVDYTDPGCGDTYMLTLKAPSAEVKWVAAIAEIKPGCLAIATHAGSVRIVLSHFLRGVNTTTPYW